MTGRGFVRAHEGIGSLDLVVELLVAGHALLHVRIMLDLTADSRHGNAHMHAHVHVHVHAHAHYSRTCAWVDGTCTCLANARTHLHMLGPVYTCACTQCLDVPLDSRSSGAKIQQFDCNRTGAQAFSVWEYSSESYIDSVVLGA